MVSGLSDSITAKSVGPYLGTPPIFFWRLPPQTNSQAKSFLKKILFQKVKGGISLVYVLILPPISEQNFWKELFSLRVKMYRVSLSRGSFLASSRECQIRPRLGRDSRLVMTPFMQVDNYSTRNFATLEPSELGLPFTGLLDLLR